MMYQFLWGLRLHPPSSPRCSQALPIAVGEEGTCGSRRVPGGPQAEGCPRSPAHSQFAATDSTAQHKCVSAVHFICIQTKGKLTQTASPRSHGTEKLTVAFHLFSFLRYKLFSNIEIFTWSKIFLSQVQATMIKRISEITRMTLQKTTESPR